MEVYGTKPVEFLSFDGQIVIIDFTSLQKNNWGASDFLALCEQTDFILLDNLTQIDLSDKNLARRFILLIGSFFSLIIPDEVYYHKVKLIVKSEVTLDQLFIGFQGKGSEEVFMAQRCLSRLVEIQTEKYLQMEKTAN